MTKGDRQRGRGSPWRQELSMMERKRRSASASNWSQSENCIVRNFSQRNDDLMSPGLI